MKGIILAGGLGTRLKPLTDYVSKGLLKVGNKPLVQYNIETLAKAGVWEICLVIRPDQASQYALAFGNGDALGCELTLRFQDQPKGIGDALLKARRWADESNVMVLLGDSIFGHYNFNRDVKQMDQNPPTQEALIYAAHEEEPSWCAQIEWAKDGHWTEIGEVRDIHEKPKALVSNDVIPGCYMYPPNVWNRIMDMSPSDRGEIEITDLNRTYLRDGLLNIRRYDGLWLDAGTDLNAYIKAQSEPNLP